MLCHSFPTLHFPTDWAMTTSRHIWPLWALTMALGCGKPEAAGTLINMYDNQFSGAVARVPVGTRVTFLNGGRSVHNATAVDGAWKSGDVAAHSSGEGRGGDVVFARPGVYKYYCSYHGTKDGRGMAGVVVVGDVSYSPSPRGAIATADSATGKVRHVPVDYPTIQAAVDAASPGDLVLVGRGVYREEVTVTTPSLVIRGIDRNETIIDGEFVRGNGVTVLADAVAVEIMTARNAILNGFFWTGVTGFRGSFLTAYNNGDYGIYAFGSKDGVFEDSYASGSPDSGFYIGQCYPCRIVIRNVVAERNGLGYSGTNAGGQLYLVSSIWRNNRAGIVPSSLDVELDPPQRNAVYAANLVIDNNNADAPAIAINSVAFGNGILLAGSVRDTVIRNVVLDHASHGIVTSPIQDRNFYPAIDNVIRDNIVFGSGRGDLANAGPGAAGNCFSGNEYRTAVPFGLEAARACQGLTIPWWSDWVPFGTIFARALQLKEPFPDWKTQAPPPPQHGMPMPESAPARVASHVFDSLHFDLAAAQLPAGTDSIVANWRKGAVPLDRTPGLLGRVAANAAFLIGPLVLCWWLFRALRRRRAPVDRPWGRRLGALVTGLVVWVAVVGLSVWYYSRI